MRITCPSLTLACQPPHSSVINQSSILYTFHMAATPLVHPWSIVSTCHMTATLLVHPRYSVSSCHTVATLLVHIFHVSHSSHSNGLPRPRGTHSPITVTRGASQSQRQIRPSTQRSPPSRGCTYRSPRHRIPLNSRNEGSSSRWVSMTWRKKCLADIARHVIGCHFHQGMMD